MMMNAYYRICNSRSLPLIYLDGCRSLANLNRISLMGNISYIFYVPWQGCLFTSSLDTAKQ